ncbi:MAG: hypothetical protein IJV68_01830 [Clostridia bacterium]|nr:hypothetical protein [Clostridia bacterium]
MKDENNLDEKGIVDKEPMKNADSSQSNNEKLDNVSKKRRKFKLTSTISASVVAVILCGAILFNHIIYPKIGPDVESTTTSGKDPNIESTTASKDDPSVPDINPLLDYIVSAPSYPVMAQYSSDHNSDEYDAWRDGIKDQRKYYNAGGNLDDFFKKSTAAILGDTTTENAIFSPINIYMTLAMIAETGSGNTRAQILNALDAENIEALREQAMYVWNACYRDDGRTMSRLSSSLWLDESIKYNERTLSNKYYASVFRGDMGSEEYSKSYNEWLKRETGGLLDDMVGDKKFSKDTVMALVSTLYFSTSWDTKFDETLTKKGIFHSPTGDVECDYMSIQQSGWRYYYGEKFTATERTLGSDGVMHLILPDEGVSINELLSNDEALSFLAKPGFGVNSAHPRVEITLPKFDISMEKNIISDLQELGITDCFDGDKADFSEFFPENNPVITEIQHGARLAVDEEGCVGASYVHVAYGGGWPPPEIVDFTLDRPFIVVVTSPDNLPLFIGIVNQP